MAFIPECNRIPSDILDDLSSRFIINAPMEEQEVPVRLCFLIEAAHWFYIDFYCAENASLKSCGMKEFAGQIVRHISYLNHLLGDLDIILEEWRFYKSSVPTYGAIVLNNDLSKVLLVQSYFAKASWGFPKGKVNEEEDPRHCAIREVLEETGFDITNMIDDKEYIESTVNDQTVRLYVVPGVNEDTKFQPKTRNEIKSVEWFSIQDLPSTKKDLTTKTKTGVGAKSFFMVYPFIKKIKKWIYDKTQKNFPGNPRRQRYKSSGEQNNTIPAQNLQKVKPVQYFHNFRLIGLDTEMNSLQQHTSNVQTTPYKKQLQEQREEPHIKIKQRNNNQTSVCSYCKSLSKTGPYFCVSPWLNFKLDRQEIMKCFDD